MSEVLDYAGLFPPAKLEMDTTVRNYHSFREGADAWMLARVIVPVARLEEFEAQAAKLLPLNREAPHPQAWAISALTVPADDANLRRDLERIQAFNERHAANGAGGAVIDAIELRVGDPESLEHALDEMPEEVYPWFELPIDRDVRGLIAALADMEAGAKVRTGGMEAAAHPSAEALGRFIEACRLARVPFKATAGLHHAVRQFVPAVNTRQFGFLNVLLGASLAWHGRLQPNELIELLADEQASHFVLDEQGAAWCDRRLTIVEIETARERFVRSFGSCSFDEPLQELRALRMLEGAAS